MKSRAEQWREATDEILRKLDIPAEYRAIGIDVCGTRENANGWIEARAFGVEDKTPSAGVCVKPGKNFGLYVDHRNGTSLRLFDVASKITGHFTTWEDARRHYAEKTGVTLPDGPGPDDEPADKISFATTPLAYAHKKIFCEQKPGITPQGIEECGGRPGTYPAKLKPEFANHVIAFPMYGGDLSDAEPLGYQIMCQVPNQKVRIYKGKGIPEEHRDKQNVGSTGMMNLDGVKNLRNSEVVNFCEGITDTLAAQSALSPWRALDSDGRRHVVLGLSGCKGRFDEDWGKLLAGKEVRVWFDTDEPGREGARRLITKLIVHTDRIRNVELPPAPGGGKNDLRSWLASGNSYADMDDYAKAFKYVEVDSPDANTTVDQEICHNLGLTVCGEHEHKQAIEVFSEVRRKAATIWDINRLTTPTLVQIIGREKVERYIWEGRDECPDDKYELKQVKIAIANEAGRKIFYDNELRGAGVWDNDGEIVLVQHKEVGILRPDGILEASYIPYSNGRILDTGAASKRWFDIAAMNKYLAQAREVNWRVEVVNEAIRIFSMWQWRCAAQAPPLVAGLVLGSWLQTLWSWRPQVFITGNSNTGKTMLLHDILGVGIFGNLGLVVEKPTEAAITQHMRHHAKVLLIDEFEKDANRQKILELFRSASRKGGNKIRGTADQRGIEYKLSYAPWMGAIEIGLAREADRNRYIILELDEVKPEKVAAFNPPSQAQLNDLGARLLACSLCSYQQTRIFIEHLRRMTVKDAPTRCVENYAVPIANLASAYGLNEHEAEVMLEEVMEAWDFKSQVLADHVDFLSHLLTAKIRLPGGRESTVTKLISDSSKSLGIEARDALENHGIKLITKRGSSEHVLWVCCEVVARDLLRGSRFDGHNVQQYGLRFKGARVTRQRVGGAERFKGVEIPLRVVQETFESLERSEADGSWMIESDADWPTVAYEDEIPA